MATNPKLPDMPPQRPVDEHGKVQLIRQSRFPWPIVAVIIGAVLLIVIFAVLPRAPHITRAPSGAQVPDQPTAEQIQFTSLNVTPAPAGDAIYLTGLLRNTGDTALTGVQVKAEFLGRNGPVLSTVTSPVEGMAGGTSSQDLTQTPIKPNESRPIRIYFEHVPNGWNHQLPELTVTNVTGTTP